MINTQYVQIGLITGTAWDRTCDFMENAVEDIMCGRRYGNYYDSESPANVAGYGQKQKTGYSDFWCVKNVYDMAGNFFEYTTEFYDSGRFGDSIIIRSAAANTRDGYSSMAYRYNLPINRSGSALGFRCRLYIK